jgi:SAM-dependent methyltransferase
MKNSLEILEEIIKSKKIEKIILASPVSKIGIKKKEIKPLIIKEIVNYQLSFIKENKAIHKNYNESEILKIFQEEIENFKQINIFTDIEEIQILRSGKGSEKILRRAIAKKEIVIKEHNKKKEYLIEDGEKCDFLIHLGVMDKDGKVNSKKYDKFRQINRYLEFIKDVITELPSNRRLKIVDFGSGKAYLTFALYYYLVTIMKKDVEIYGVDIKKDVIEFCNKTANELNYINLKFVYGDIKSFDTLNNADFVVTLHACDTATDDAIVQAVKWNAKVIMCVPCCQHEFFNKIENKSMNSILKHGILKEKIASIITDSLRGNVLEIMGYKVQLIEFIDMEHTPKNILIRAIRKKDRNYKEVAEYVEFKKIWNITPYIERAFKEELGIDLCENVKLEKGV